MSKLQDVLIASIEAGAKTSGGSFYKKIKDLEENVKPNGSTVVLGDVVKGKNDDGRKFKLRSLTVDLGDLGQKFISIASAAIKKEKFTIAEFKALDSMGRVNKNDIVLRAY